MKKYAQRKVVYLGASAAFALVYSGLQNFPYALEIASSAAFTILVLGNYARRAGRSLFRGEQAKSRTEFLVVHTLGLASLLGILRLGADVSPRLPALLNHPLGPPVLEHPAPTPLQVLQSLVILGLCWLEVTWLSAKSAAVEGDGPAPGQEVVWGQAALEKSRLNRLRLD